MNKYLIGVRVKRTKSTIDKMVSVPKENKQPEKRGWFYEGKNLDFSDALMFLKEGKKLIREGWKHQYIVMIDGARYDTFEMMDTDDVIIHPHIAIVVNDNEITPWFASQADLFAEDWCVVS